MKICLIKIAAVQCACLVGLAIPSSAQVQRGSIYGTVHDATGAVLPGVMVQLTSEIGAPREGISESRGVYRFPDLDPGPYTLRAALPGFAPLVRRDILVGVGTSVEIGIEMVLEAVSEEVVVEAATPVLDVRRQGNVTNFDQVMLNEVPTPRDPWALMQHLPGVTIARPNVGGSESTNQAQYSARGDNGANTMWNIDGVTITDMAAVGASTTYFDFNVFEEVQFTTGGLDSRQQTGGLGINLVSKRGANALRASGRAYFSNDELQGENVSSELKTAGFFGNRIQQLAEYGGDVSGPLRPDRLWFWAGMSKTDVRQVAANGFPDDGSVNTTAARGDAQLGGATRFSFLYHRAEKLKEGRFAAPNRPPETTLNQDGPTYIYKAEASRVFEPALFVSAKFAYVDLGFGLTPQSGLGSQAYQDVATGIWHGGFSYSRSDRSQSQTQLDGNWSRARHDVKFGLHYRQTTSLETGGWPGDRTYTLINAERLGLPTGVGLAYLTRPIAAASGTDAWSVYAGDVLALDRWTFDAGVRVDSQRTRNNPSQAPANGLEPTILPALEYPGGTYRTWTDFSPRLGATFRLTDRTIARASYARYANQMGSIIATFENAAQPGEIEYRFQDLNGDRLAQTSELLGPTGVVRGVNPANPAAPYAPNQVDPNVGSQSTHVFVGGLERELMPNFSLGVNVGRSEGVNTIWSSFIGLTREDFVEYRPTLASGLSLTTPVYRLRSGVTLPPGNGRELSNREGYERRYWNIDLLATKRLADRWMFRGFVTRQQQREYFEDPAQSIQDPTPRLEGGPTLFNLSSGLIDGGIAVNSNQEFIIHSTWSYSLAGLYELPWEVSVSGTLYGRQGNPTAEVLTVNRPDGLGQTRVLIDRDLDAKRFPSVHLLDLRLQKRVALGRIRATLDFDVFNALNTDSTLRQFGDAVTTTFGNPLEIVAPRLVRLGLQVQF